MKIKAFIPTLLLASVATFGLVKVFTNSKTVETTPEVVETRVEVQKEVVVEPETVELRIEEKVQVKPAPVVIVKRKTVEKRVLKKKVVAKKKAFVAKKIVTKAKSDTVTLKASSVATLTKTIKQKPFPVGLQVALTTSGTANELNKYSDTISTDAEFFLKYSAPYEFAITAYFAASKDFAGYREQTLANGALLVSRPIGKLGKFISFSASSATTIPLSKKFKEEQSGITTVHITPSTSINLQAIQLKYVTVGYSFRYKKYFHKYTRANNGNANRDFYIRNRGTVSYTPFEWMNLSVAGAYYQVWTYAGNRLKDKYEFSQEIGFDVTTKFSVSFGHELGVRKAFKENGTDSNFEMFDRDDSTLYSTLSYLF